MVNILSCIHSGRKPCNSINTTTFWNMTQCSLFKPIDVSEKSSADIQRRKITRDGNKLCKIKKQADRKEKLTTIPDSFLHSPCILRPIHKRITVFLYAEGGGIRYLCNVGKFI
jgi:hypothetical protein